MRVLSCCVICLVCAASAKSQSGLSATCDSLIEPRTYQDAITTEANPAFNRPAVIFGEAKEIPEMRIRIIDGSSGEPLKNEGVRIVYGWRWLEYPYPEHAWGAWNDTGDKLSCHLDKDGRILAPQHLVQPRGWYDGKYAHRPWSRKPTFTDVELVAVTTGGFARIHLESKDLRRFSNSILLVRVFDSWRTEATWLPIP